MTPARAAELLRDAVRDLRAAIRRDVDACCKARVTAGEVWCRSCQRGIDLWERTGQVMIDTDPRGVVEPDPRQVTIWDVAPPVEPDGGKAGC